jgi:hypothetical protein
LAFCAFGASSVLAARSQREAGQLSLILDGAVPRPWVDLFSIELRRADACANTQGAGP